MRFDFSTTVFAAALALLLASGASAQDAATPAFGTPLTDDELMPDDIDGRYLFHAATRSFYSKSASDSGERKNVSLSNVVMVESVKEARERDVLHSVRPFKAFSETGVIWPDGTESEFDAVIWCTGFKANLKHLEPLGLIENHRIETRGTRSVAQPNLWLVGYGGWTG